MPQRPVVSGSFHAFFLNRPSLCNLSCYPRRLLARERDRPQPGPGRCFPSAEFTSLIDEIGPELDPPRFFQLRRPLRSSPSAGHDRTCQAEVIRMSISIPARTACCSMMRKSSGWWSRASTRSRFRSTVADQRTYARYRRGGDFERSCGSWPTWSADATRPGREVPFINWRYILFNWNDSGGSCEKRGGWPTKSASTA